MYTTLLVVCLSQIDYGHHFTKILLAEYLFKEALIASPRDAPTTRKHAKRRNAPPPIFIASPCDAPTTRKHVKQLCALATFRLAQSGPDVIAAR